MSREQLSLVDARRVALHAQGFGATYSGTDRAKLTAVLNTIGVLQIDSVNVLVRSQELPLFARIGAHDRDVIGKAVERGQVFEYWMHEASLASTELHRYMRWKMDRPHPWFENIYNKNKALVERLYAQVRDEGPLKASDVSMRVGKKGKWWDWDDAKQSLEYLFFTGRITTRRRDTDFARVYELPERLFSAKVLNARTPSEFESRRELLRRAASHLGVATFTDLADYYRQKPKESRDALQSLVEDRILQQVSVESWSQPAFMLARARIPGKVTRCALLSPFDSLVWNRERNERLFNFHYRIEIYTPQPKRKFGYYVLPVLCGEQLVGRLDLKADRGASTLRVLAAHKETKVNNRNVVGSIARELHAMSRWLGLEQLHVVSRGNLSRALASAVKSKRG